MLKNYTSSVAANISIMKIEKCLINHGAKQIAKDYHDNITVGIKFVMNIEGRDTIFSLPARIDRCKQVFIEQRVNRISNEAMKKITAQAERTAWKIVLDWVEAQMAMIDLAQIEMLEVFLPYVYVAESDQTFFEVLKEKKFKALLPAAG